MGQAIGFRIQRSGHVLLMSLANAFLQPVQHRSGDHSPGMCGTLKADGLGLQSLEFSSRKSGPTSDFETSPGQSPSNKAEHTQRVHLGPSTYPIWYRSRDSEAKTFQSICLPTWLDLGSKRRRVQFCFCGQDSAAWRVYDNWRFFSWCCCLLSCMYDMT